LKPADQIWLDGDGFGPWHAGLKSYWRLDGTIPDALDSQLPAERSGAAAVEILDNPHNRASKRMRNRLATPPVAPTHL